MDFLHMDMEVAIFGDENTESVEVPADDPVAELFSKFDDEKRADLGWLAPVGDAHSQEAETVHKRSVPSETSPANQEDLFQKAFASAASEIRRKVSDGTWEDCVRQAACEHPDEVAEIRELFRAELAAL